MKKLAKFFVMALIVTSCATGTKVMSRYEFSEIEIGEDIKVVVNSFGEPYSIRSRGADCDIYEYIEKIKMDYLTIQQRRYYLVVTKGRVVGKYVKFSNPPPYEQIYNDETYPVY